MFKRIDDILFDLDKIKHNISLLKKHIQPDKILFAVKCNSLDKVLEKVFNQGAGFEINNQGENENKGSRFKLKGMGSECKVCFGSY